MGRQGLHIASSVAGEVVRTFVPPPLPPDPPIDLTRFWRMLDRANQTLGRLDDLATMLPDPHLFIYHYVRKEAVLSSQIEGTQSSLSDLLLFEIDESPGVPVDDVIEVSGYVAAMEHGLERLRDGFPLSLRLIREIHGILRQNGRGSGTTPGEFRRSQNWIGGTRPGNALFVPPPHDQVPELMGRLELFLHDESHGLPILIKAGLAHVQFETIHPFLDGNGRLGRLLITFLLCANGVLSEPLLYLSLYLKTRRNEYYDLLQRVRTQGAWEDWLEFFLDGVTETAMQASQIATDALALFEEDRRKLQRLGKASGTSMRLHEHLRHHPLSTIGMARLALGRSVPAVTGAIENMIALGMVREVTGRKRDRVFAYTRYLSLLSTGTEATRADTA